MGFKIQLFLEDGLFLDAVQCIQQHPVDQHNTEQKAGPGQQEPPGPHQLRIKAAGKYGDDPAGDGRQQPDDPPQLRGVDPVDLPGGVVEQPVHGQTGQGAQRQTEHTAFHAAGTGVEQPRRQEGGHAQGDVLIVDQ